MLTNRFWLHTLQPTPHGFARVSNQVPSSGWKLEMGNCEPHFNPKAAHFELPSVIAEAAMTAIEPKHNDEKYK